MKRFMENVVALAMVLLSEQAMAIARGSRLMPEQGHQNLLSRRVRLKQTQGAHSECSCMQFSQFEQKLVAAPAPAAGTSCPCATTTTLPPCPAAEIEVTTTPGPCELAREMAKAAAEATEQRLEELTPAHPCPGPSPVPAPAPAPAPSPCNAQMAKEMADRAVQQVIRRFKNPPKLPALPPEGRPRFFAPFALRPLPDWNAAGGHPFMVSMKVQIDGPDKEKKAQELSTAINSAGTDAAKIFAFSMARVPSNTFPPPEVKEGPNGLEIVTPAPDSPGPAPGPAPGPGPGPAPAPLDFRMAAVVASEQAYALAKQNAQQFEGLKTRLTLANADRRAALYYKPSVPLPNVATTTSEPATFGRLVYDALINTPVPPTTTISPVMAAQEWSEAQRQLMMRAVAGWPGEEVAPAPAPSAG